MGRHAELTPRWLEENDLGRIRARHVQALDSVDHLDELREVGRKVAEQVVAEHFAG
ncbi:hypothetical protein [Nakamurella sp.]|uniref:hypothetical protein n=1 Tax=Nakamurella sp. TaxID=1869182 RepID=UPI0037833EEF